MSFCTQTQSVHNSTLWRACAWLRVWYRVTGVYFREPQAIRCFKDRFIQSCRVLIAFFLLLCLLLGLLSSLEKLLTEVRRKHESDINILDQGDNTEIFALVLDAVWRSNQIVALVFLVKWNITGETVQIMREVVQFNKEQGIKKKVASIKRRIFGLMGMLALVYFSTVASVIAMLIMAPSQAFQPFEFMCFDVKFPAQLGFCLIMFGWSVWLGALATFSCLMRTLFVELRQFNDEMIDERNNLANGDVLLGFFVRHNQMNLLLNRANRLFSIYVFHGLISSMFGLTVVVYSRLVTTNKIGGTTPSLTALLFDVFLAAWVYAFTFAMTAWTPSRIYDHMFVAQTVVLQEAAVWGYYDKKRDAIARAFMSKMGGMSYSLTLWGFAKISQPLFITVCSTVFTYLTLLVQFKQQVENAASLNSTELNSTTQKYSSSNVSFDAIAMFMEAAISVFAVMIHNEALAIECYNCMVLSEDAQGTCEQATQKCGGSNSTAAACLKTSGREKTTGTFIAAYSCWPLPAKDDCSKDPPMGASFHMRCPILGNHEVGGDTYDDLKFCTCQGDFCNSSSRLAPTATALFVHAIFIILSYVVEQM